MIDREERMFFILNWIYNNGRVLQKAKGASMWEPIYQEYENIYGKTHENFKESLRGDINGKAQELGLVKKINKGWILTEKGNEYVEKSIKGQINLADIKDALKIKKKKRKSTKEETPQLKIIEREVVKPEKIIVETKQDNNLLIGSLIVTNLVVLLLALSSMF